MLAILLPASSYHYWGVSRKRAFSEKTWIKIFQGKKNPFNKSLLAWFIYALCCITYIVWPLWKCRRLFEGIFRYLHFYSEHAYGGGGIFENKYLLFSRTGHFSCWPLPGIQILLPACRMRRRTPRSDPNKSSSSWAEFMPLRPHPLLSSRVWSTSSFPVIEWHKTSGVTLSLNWSL